MGQWETYDFLKENKGKWFTAREIADQLGVSFGSVIGSLKRLRRAGLIEFKKVEGEYQDSSSLKKIYAYRLKNV